MIWRRFWRWIKKCSSSSSPLLKRKKIWTTEKDGGSESRDKIYIFEPLETFGQSADGDVNHV